MGWHTFSSLSNKALKARGFTIVELLIVIVVIAILAAITIVAYNGVTARTNDSRRQEDIAAIAKALELYYIDNGRYPAAAPGGSTTINASWNTSADTSWQTLQAKLVPKYLPSLPTDPANTTGTPTVGAGGKTYDYFVNESSYCGAAAGQMYILAYRLNGQQVSTYDGACTTNGLTYYPGASTWRVVRG